MNKPGIYTKELTAQETNTDRLTVSDIVFDIAEEVTDKDYKTGPHDYYFPLFDLMDRAHGLTLVTTDMNEIINVVRHMLKQQDEDCHKKG